MRHEKIIKREDGSRVVIVASFHFASWAKELYTCDVYCIEPKKRKRKLCFDDDSWAFRQLSMSERQEYIKEQNLKFATQDELYQAKLECWAKLRPAQVKG